MIINKTNITWDSNIKISRREFECLYYLVRGKTMKGIAREMGGSPRTVEEHINQLKLKLNCTTKYELLDKIWQSDFPYFPLDYSKFASGWA